MLKHAKQIRDSENLMIKKVSLGALKCMKDVESVTGSEFEVINHKVRTGVDKIRTRLDSLREIRDSFYEMSVIEKLLRVKAGEEVASEPPPSLDFASEIIEKLKAKIDYEQCIKEKKLIIN